MQIKKYRESLKIHFGRQANLFDSGRRQKKQALASAKPDFSSLPEYKNLLLSAQKQLLELPYNKTLISLGLFFCFLTFSYCMPLYGQEIGSLKKSLINNPISHQVKYEKLFAEYNNNQTDLKKKGLSHLAAGFKAYLDGLYPLAVENLKKCEGNKFIKDLMSSGFLVSIDQIIAKCGDVKCTECDGSRKIDCAKCSGSGWDLCRRCLGSGLEYNYSRAPGSGDTVGGAGLKCVQCDGLTASRCDNCLGSGLVDCPLLSESESVSGRLLYDPITNEIKKILTISVYLIDGGVDIYSFSALKKAPLVAK